MESFNIGQLRRDQMDDSGYATDCSYKADKLLNDESVVDFYDFMMDIAQNPVNQVNSYYLKFEVKQMTDATQDFNLILMNKDSQDDRVQNLKKLSVQKGIESTSFELIFTPNNTYNAILFELRRTPDDFSIANPDGTYGREMTVTITAFNTVNNIIDGYLKGKYSGLESLRKIGIQGPPGLLFALNGEEMRVGRSGIYELNIDDIFITYLGFVIKESPFVEDGKDYFIMDFQY